jgi:hypothetical protein
MIKFKDYVDQLIKFLSENPETADYQVIYSRDDEGNSYDQVYYGPSKGTFDENSGDFKENKDSDNSVCIN